MRSFGVPFHFGRVGAYLVSFGGYVGLNFLHLLRTEAYRKFACEVFNRDNPVFYAVVDKRRLFRSGLLHSYAGVQYLKLKMILDIFYYRELDELLENERYEKTGW